MRLFIWLPLFLSGCGVSCSGEATLEKTTDTGTATTTVTVPTTGTSTTTPTTDTGTATCVAVAEVCDGLDNDCDGVADNGLSTTYYTDADGDGFGDLSTLIVVFCDQIVAPTMVRDNTDCNDADATVNPDAEDDTCDGVDQNCNGTVDDGVAVTTEYLDSDMDGFGDPSSSTTYTCVGLPGYISDNTDCDDGNAGINPDAADVACDGVDQDCDGIDAAGLSTTYYADADGDTFGDSNSPTDVACGDAVPAGLVLDNTDCDDRPGAGVNTFPGAAENQYLNPASHYTDPLACMKDDDGDGYGDAYPWNLLPGVVAGTDCFDGPGCVGGDDCLILNPDTGAPIMGADVYYNSLNPELNHVPGNDYPESCEPYVDDDVDGFCNSLDEDGIDNDLNGVVDDEAWCFFDLPSGDCENTDPEVSHDDNAAVNPGVAEVPGDGIDNNCDGVVDENDPPAEDTGDPGPADCAVGQSRLTCTYVAPVGATNILVSSERYADATSWPVAGMAVIADGVNGWTVDTSVAGQVTVSDGTCQLDTDWWYLSASFTGAGSYSCSGTANPSYTAYGSFTCEFDGTGGTVRYVNNYETPIGFPGGYGPGCEIGLDH